MNSMSAPLYVIVSWCKASVGLLDKQKENLQQSHDIQVRNEMSSNVRNIRLPTLLHKDACWGLGDAQETASVACCVQVHKNTMDEPSMPGALNI